MPSPEHLQPPDAISARPLGALWCASPGLLATVTHTSLHPCRATAPPSISPGWLQQREQQDEPLEGFIPFSAALSRLTRLQSLRMLQEQLVLCSGALRGMGEEGGVAGSLEGGWRHGCE